MAPKSAILSLMMVPTLQGFHAQSSSEKETPCLYIPNVMSIRCDDYNKDYTLEISATAPCIIEKLEVYTRWGNVVYSTQNPPWEWYGGREPMGVYMVRVSYTTQHDNTAPKAQDQQTITREVTLIK